MKSSLAFCLNKIVGLTKIQINAKAFGKTLSISVLNQMVSSGTNFVLGLYLVRLLSPEEYGLYAIGFAISMFYAGIGNALFLTQMIVHTPDKNLEDRLPYSARMFVAVLIFCLSTIIIICLIIVVGKEIFGLLANYAKFSIAVTAASVAFLLKDFFVRHAYNVKKEIWALKINMTLALGLLIFVSMQYFFHTPLTVNVALWMYALAHGFSVIYGYRSVCLPINMVTLAVLKVDVIEAWKHGKWAVAQNLVYWIRTQAQTYVSAIFSGPTAVGLINATRLLISPILFLMPAISQIILPRLAEARNSGKHKILRLAFIATIALMTCSIFYSFFLLIFLKAIAKLLLGAQYSNDPSIHIFVSLWCFVLFVQVAQNIATSLSQAMMNFRGLTFANFIASIAAVLLAITFYHLIGLPGTILGTIVGETLLLIILWRFLRRA